MHLLDYHAVAPRVTMSNLVEAGPKSSLLPAQSTLNPALLLPFNNPEHPVRICHANLANKCLIVN